MTGLAAPNKVYVGGWINGGDAVATSVAQVAEVKAPPGVASSLPGAPLGAAALSITPNTGNYVLNTATPAPLTIHGTGFGTVPTANRITFYENAAGTRLSPPSTGGSWFSITACTDTSLVVNFNRLHLPNVGPLYAKVETTWAYPLKADGTFATDASPSVPFFDVATLAGGVSFDRTTNGNDRLVFVAAPTQPAFTSSAAPWQNYPVTVLPANTSTVPPGPFGILEFGYDAQFNTSYVDSFGLNWSFVDDAAPAVVYGVRPTVTRQQMQTAYSQFTTNDALGAAFKPLLWTSSTTPVPAVVEGQFTAIVSPKDWLAQPSPPANLQTYWNDTVNQFFAPGNRLSVDFNGTIYAGSVDPTGDHYTLNPGPNAVVIPKSLYAGTNIFSQLQTDNSPVAGQIKDNVFEAFSRGVALDGVWKAGRPGTMPAGYSSTTWTTYANWYKPGATTYDPAINRTYDVYAKFFHYATSDGRDFRTVADGEPMLGLNPDKSFAMAYGFSLDESPSVRTAGGGTWPTARSVNGGTTINGGGSITVTFGPWTASAPMVVSIDTSPRQQASTPTPTSASSVTWTVAFNEPVSGVTAANFTLAPGGSLAGTSITSVTPGGGPTSQTWTVTANTGTGTGTLGLNLTSATGIKDATAKPLSLPGGQFTGQVYSVRPTPVGPTATIAIAGTNPTNAATVPFRVTFSQAVTGLTAASFTTVVGGGITGASVQSVSGSGTTYTVTVNTGTGSGRLALRLIAPGTGITPAPTGLPVTSRPYTIDKNDPTAAPRVLGIDRGAKSPTNAASVSWTVRFTEPVTGLTAANFDLAIGGLGGTPAITGVTPVPGTNTATWTVTASTGSGSGTLGLDMANSTNVHDADSRAVTNVPFAGSVYTVDRTAPAASSIARADANPTALPQVTWTVRFSEPVAGVSKQNFQLVSTGLNQPVLLQVSPVGGSPSATWTVTGSTGSGSGSLRLDLVDAASITDAASLAPTGIPLAGQAYTVQRGGATIVDVPIAFMTTAGTASKLVWLMPAFTDSDSVQLTAALSASPASGGTFRATSGGGVAVTPSGTAGSELRFSGTVAALNAYFQDRAGFITYTPTAGALVPRTLTLSAQGSDGLSGFATAALLVRAAAMESPAPAVNPTALLPGTAGQALVITYAQLVAATGATQTTSRSIQFMLGGLSSGRLEVWNAGRWTAVPSFVNIPLLAPGGRIRWTPPVGASGVRAAFSVKTWDGWRLSGLSQVSANLAQ